MPTAQQKLVTLAQLQMQAERIKLELAKYPQTEVMNQAITDKIASVKCYTNVVTGVANKI